MYDDIVGIYAQIFPLNQVLLDFLHKYLPEGGGRVLDLGCGPGEMVGHLASEGYHAVGIDRSEGMISAAKARHEGIFYPYGFNEIHQLQSPFNFIYCVGNSLSYLPNNQFDDFMAKISGLLLDGGTFLVQVVNWDRFLGQGQFDFEVKPLSDGRSFHRRYEPGEGGTVLFHTWLQLGKQVLGEWIDLLYPKTSEFLQEAVSGAGMSPLRMYGNFESDGFDPKESPALIMTARL